MARRAIAMLMACGLASFAVIVTATIPSELAAANKAKTSDKPASRRPIRNPKYDSSAVQVDLFDAVDAGQVVVRLIPKDAMGGNVLIENKTDKPLTVKIPDAVVGVSIHAQLGNLFGGNAANGNNLGLGNSNAAGAGANRQIQGGGVNQGNAAGPGNGQQPGNGLFPGVGMGMNFFSVPAERIISLPFNSVCLEHGKPEPDSSCKYTLAPVSRISTDPVLYQLLTAVGAGKVDVQAAQAAAWHLSNQMSFQELADKMVTPLGGLPPTPYFSKEQIQRAKQLLEDATERASKDVKDKITEAPLEATTTVATSRSARTN